jgi:hypothetical protein
LFPAAIGFRLGRPVEHSRLGAYLPLLPQRLSDNSAQEIGHMRRIRFALRSLAKSPLLSSVVVLSLGLGIGVNTAIFSLLNQVVLSALPVPHPEQLELLTSPGNLKNGRTNSNDSGSGDYIFN